MSGHQSRNSAGASPDLRHLVRAASQLQEQVRSAVQRLEQSTTTSGERLHTGEETELQGTSQGRQGGTEWSIGRAVTSTGGTECRAGPRAERTPVTQWSGNTAAVPRLNLNSATTGRFTMGAY